MFMFCVLFRATNGSVNGSIEQEPSELSVPQESPVPIAYEYEVVTPTRAPNRNQSFTSKYALQGL